MNSIGIHDGRPPAFRAWYGALKMSKWSRVFNFVRLHIFTLRGESRRKIGPYWLFPVKMIGAIRNWFFQQGAIYPKRGRDAEARRPTQRKTLSKKIYWCTTPLRGRCSSGIDDGRPPALHPWFCAQKLSKWSVFLKFVKIIHRPMIIWSKISKRKQTGSKCLLISNARAVAMAPWQKMKKTPSLLATK